MSDTDVDPVEGADTDIGTDAAVPAVPDLDGDTTPDDQGAEPGAARRRIDWGLLVACLVIAGGLVAIAWGVGSAITGSDGIDRPDAIEDLSPVENAQQAFQQEQIMVDLEFGYEAELIVDGIELPTSRIGEFSGDLTPESAGTQVSAPPTAVFDPGNSIITFRPSDDALIQSYSEGRHTVQVVFWKTDEGRENARSYRWSFDVV
ncbi:MAG: hypothetical protein ABJH68_08650 [Ilumatobacter sp.]|uniref:hypothetical protein n=1 Tax=Ilumatobacter sp. TaxID=1967498 RepID=UPI0032971F93